jgi:hypothetical protein
MHFSPDFWGNLMKRIFLAVLCCLFTVYAENQSDPPDTVAETVGVDTAATKTSEEMPPQEETSGDSLSVNEDAKKEAVKKPTPGGIGRRGEKPGQKMMDTSEKESEQSNVRKIKLVKRNYNYRQQIWLAIGMMAFVALMMTTAQTLNPK